MPSAVVVVAETSVVRPLCRGRASRASEPSSPPALAPTRVVTAGDADVGSSGFTARENCTSRTWVLPLVCSACRVSARETALAMSTARPGCAEVAETATIGASGEVAVLTLSRRVRSGTPAHTWASPSTASCVATRPYACAKPRADSGWTPRSVRRRRSWWPCRSWG
ncbi:hypothetical protein ACR6C2_16490 [Streptomyces sp. INA 01156]